MLTYFAAVSGTGGLHFNVESSQAQTYSSILCKKYSLLKKLQWYDNGAIKKTS